MTFRERFMAGEAEFDEIFDLTDEWNFSDLTCTLREFLGLTEEEEDVWISDSDEALEELMEKEKRRTVFFADYDGTLLTDDKKVSPENAKALHALQKAGHYFVTSTGRTLPSALRQFQNLGLKKENSFIICYNGGQIYDLEQGELIYSCSVPMELVSLCFEEARKQGVHIQTYTQSEVIAEADHPDLQEYCRLQDLPCRVVDSVVAALDQEPAKLLCIGEPEELHRFRSHMESLCGDRLSLFMSQHNYLEIVPPGVSKGFAVEFLCRRLQIPVSRTIAVGDAENDISMLQAAGMGVAMCNGTQAVKDAADYVTQKDNNHDGIAEILYKFVL